MAWPVSIGDAIMLSKLAYKLEHAFTSGRKSAPAEFQEIQSQLFALGGALELVASDRSEELKDAGVNVAEARKEKKPGAKEDILERMISNCRETLKHLELLVEKYTEIDPNARSSSQTGIRKWQQDVKKNWKKIKWTTEGGDLDKLRSNLNVHINGLNLAISAMRSTQTRNIETQLNGVDTKITELFEWYTENLKHPKEEPAIQKPRASSPQSSEVAPRLIFQVFAEVPGSAVMGLICPKASFHHDWLVFRDRGSTPGLFQCHCSSNKGYQYPTGRVSDEDHKVHLQFSLLPVTLITRLVGLPNLWQLHVVSRQSNGWVSLILGGIAPSDFAGFRQCVDQLAIEQVKGNQLDSMLMHSILDGVQENIRVLYSKCDSRQYTGLISRITFIVQENRFTEESIDSIEFLHYQSLLQPKFQDLEDPPNATLRHQRHAELIFRAVPAQLGKMPYQNPNQYIVNIEHDTEITRLSTSRMVCLHHVECSEEKEDSEPERIPFVDMELDFISSSVAEGFQAKLMAMQKELFILYLCFPRTGERIILQRSAGNLMIQDFYLPDATLSVVFDPLAKEYRMIVLSHCASVCVSMKLSPSFDNAAPNSTTASADKYPAYFVKVGWDTTTIEERATGFKFFLPANEDAQQFLRIVSQMSIEEGPAA